MRLNRARNIVKSLNYLQVLQALIIFVSSVNSCL